MTLLTIFLIVSCSIITPTTTAWSSHNHHHQPPPLPPTTTTINRQSFLQKVITSTITAATLIETLPPTVSPAVAFQNNSPKGIIYSPPPNSQIGKVHVITGATTGLGLESAKRIARACGTVVLTSRTSSKGMAAVQRVRESLDDDDVTNNEIYYLTLDLDDLDSVRSFPRRYNELLPKRSIDVLMNNAGVTGIPERELTKDGFERTFQSNYLGPFALTALLFPYLNRSGEGSRIINVSSLAHTYCKDPITNKPGLNLNNLNSELSYTGIGWSAYAQTKLENVYFTRELQRRATDAGMEWLTVVALHPGLVGTDIWRTTPLIGVKNNNSLSSLTSRLFYSKAALTTEEGANTQVWLATVDATKGVVMKGQYYDENGMLKQAATFALDDEKARELWKATEALLGLTFDVV